MILEDWQEHVRRWVKASGSDCEHTLLTLKRATEVNEMMNVIYFEAFAQIKSLDGCGNSIVKGSKQWLLDP